MDFVPSQVQSCLSLREVQLLERHQVAVRSWGWVLQPAGSGAAGNAPSDRIGGAAEAASSAGGGDGGSGNGAAINNAGRGGDMLGGGGARGDGGSDVAAAHGASEVVREDDGLVGADGGGGCALALALTHVPCLFGAQLTATDLKVRDRRLEVMLLIH